MAVRKGALVHASRWTRTPRGRCQMIIPSVVVQHDYALSNERVLVATTFPRKYACPVIECQVWDTIGFTHECEQPTRK